MKGYKKCAADQFLGRCLIVNELSSRPLDQVDQVDQVDKPQSQLPLPIKYKWVFWAALLLSQLSGSIDIFLAGPFAKLLILGNPETLFCQFKTVGVLRIEVFVIVGSWFNRAGSYLFPWLNPSVFKYLESKHIKGPTGHTASYSVCSIQIF